MTAKVRIDPELRRQLDSAASSKQPIEAVVLLRSPRTDKSRRSFKGVSRTKTSKSSKSGASLADQIDTVVKELLKRAEMKSGAHPKDFNVFRNMGSFVVVADAAFVKALMDEPEIESIVANRQPASIELLGKSE